MLVIFVVLTIVVAPALSPSRPSPQPAQHPPSRVVSPAEGLQGTDASAGSTKAARLVEVLKGASPQDAAVEGASAEHVVE